MKWITGLLVGLGVGLVIGVITFIISLYLLWTSPPSSWGHAADVIGFVYAAIYGVIAGVIAGVVVFFLVGSGIYSSTVTDEDLEAEMIKQQDLEAQVPASLIEQPEMGTCIYCGKEIGEETAICDDCLKG